MGRALVGGIISAGVLDAKNITVIDPDTNSLTWWREHQAQVNVDSNLKSGTQDANLVILAVKPNVMPDVAKQDNGVWDGKLVVSIAAGVTIRSLTDWIGHQRIIRVMPNTPSLVGAGASAFCGGGGVTKQDRESIHSILSSVGLSVEVTESQMDAVTAVSGSGPAYICLIIEALADGGVHAGLPRALAVELATQTVLGTAKMIAETGKHPGELKDAVASPAGTTIAGLRALEQNGIRAAMIEAVQAAFQRSKELSNTNKSV